jgi:hypothetical protein
MVDHLTTNFQLRVPDFTAAPWHSTLTNTFDRVDSILYGLSSASLVAFWINSTVYLAGNIRRDPATEVSYICLVPHTSAAAPTTFAQDRITHPTYWQESIGLAQRVFNPLNHGVVYDPAVDNTNAINATIAEAVAAGGGIIVIEGYCRMDSCLTIPFVGTTPPVQKPIHFLGSCVDWTGNLDGSSGLIGAVLDLRYTGADGLHPAKIDTRGSGVLSFERLSIRSGGVDNFLILQTTNTAVIMNNVTIVGNAANSTTACQQDAIQLGGITNASSVLKGVLSTNGFMGFGTSFTDVRFAHIRHAINFGGTANAVQCTNLITDLTCGSGEAHGAPYTFYGVGLGNSGNVFVGGIIEMANQYPHGWAIFGNVNQGPTLSVFGTGLWDNGGVAVSAVYAEQATGSEVGPFFPGFQGAAFLAATGGSANLVNTGSGNSTWASWVPVLTSKGGAITSYNILSATYTRNNKKTDWRIRAQMTNIGTASIGLLATMPVVVGIIGAGPVSGFNETTGKGLCGSVAITATDKADIRDAGTGGFPAANGDVLDISGWFQA